MSGPGSPLSGAGPVALRAERDGQVAVLTLAKPKANVLDAAMVEALRAAVREVPRGGATKLVVLDHEGPNFSFGASVEEHLPEAVAGMLAGFHALLRELDGLGVPLAAVVRGQCLGGGLELALVAGRLFADGTARLGLPEVRLAVFPPAGSVLAPLRCGLAAAMDLVVTGSVIDAARAKAIGLVDAVDDDPMAACLAWFDAGLAPHSAVAIRHGWRAVRMPVTAALGAPLAAAEALYLRELMAHRDPVEGLTAFVGRRAPTWEHR